MDIIRFRRAAAGVAGAVGGNDTCGARGGEDGGGEDGGGEDARDGGRDEGGEDACSVTGERARRP